MTPFEVSRNLKLSGRHLSMDAPFSQGEDNKLLDVIQNDHHPSPDSNLMQESLKNEINRALSTLTKRESKIVKLYFWFEQDHPLTLEEIGEQLSLTRERIRQIKDKAINRLRHVTRSRALRTYLD
jgi:RNA polymerase primary sigma factor